ncbi:hypothetical protein EDD11_009732 [Mortierella claussenii]|nr:hypothetical protein EDD11_009732 [Mortierella claussenii]
MEFYSFKYPPRPIPSDSHRPSRYYFFNLGQSPILNKTQFSFQKEGIAPRIMPSTAVASSLKHTTSNMTLSMETPTPTTTTTASVAAPTTTTSGLQILDRAKFLVD